MMAQSYNGIDREDFPAMLHHKEPEEAGEQ
jgi:hypothetical protein